MMIHPLISVIIPVYNAEKYLKQCLNSVINQTYSNIEIICVDDGSNDKSRTILDNVAEDDHRIIVISKQNTGVSQTRNTGLRTATGDYILFADADDWIELDTCEQALNAIEQHQADVVMWSYVSENNGTQSYKKIFDSDRVFNEMECKKKLHRRFIGIVDNELTHPELADSLCPVWGKLYKRSLVENSGACFVSLNEIGTYEDGLFNLEVFGCVKKAVYLDRNYYHYRRDNENSTTSKYNPYLFERWQNLYLRMESYIKENKLPMVYMQALQNRRALGLLGLSINIVRSDSSVDKKIRYIREILKDKRYVAAYSALKYQYFPLHWKVFYGCAKWKMAVGVYMLGEMIQWIITH